MSKERKTPSPRPPRTRYRFTETDSFGECNKLFNKHICMLESQLEMIDSLQAAIRGMGRHIKQLQEQIAELQNQKGGSDAS